MTFYAAALIISEVRTSKVTALADTNFGPRHPVPAVGAYIIRNEEILLIRRAAEPDKDKWSIPGGRIEWGETMQEAVKREVLEETGLVVEVGEVAGVIDRIVRQDDEIAFHYLIIDFFADVVSGEVCPATDVSDCRWVPLSEIRKMDVTNTVVDMLADWKLIQ